MGAFERKQREKELKRNDIIEAAERVFFEKGYTSSTMDDVAKEAEFSKRTVYLYFNSKEQIYFEIMLKGYKLLIAMLEEDISQLGVGSAIERVKQIGITLIKFKNKHPNYFEAIVEYETGEKDFEKGIPDHSRDECYQQGEKVLSFLTDSLIQGMKDGSIREGLNVLDTAFVLWSSTIGAFTIAKKKANYIRKFHNRNPEDLIHRTYDVLIHSIQR
ncbi:TetR/AcrR family transcriptional regulator [Bacillus sp. J33]|uniref:TetR/AcrR family transcriptional regulator n=1 Tax=Bacillus sp. J33 TaxID=935836 RepID=UPI00047CB5AC|nr:TetR/AcrR family transcriptional regulator [Bacillus sp. J33]